MVNNVDVIDDLKRINVNGCVLESHDAVLVFDDGSASNLDFVAKRVLLLLVNHGANDVISSF